MAFNVGPQPGTPEYYASRGLSGNQFIGSGATPQTNPINNIVLPSQPAGGFYNAAPQVNAPQAQAPVTASTAGQPFNAAPTSAPLGTPQAVAQAAPTDPATTANAVPAPPATILGTYAPVASQDYSSNPSTITSRQAALQTAFTNGQHDNNLIMSLINNVPDANNTLQSYYQILQSNDVPGYQNLINKLLNFNK